MFAEVVVDIKSSNTDRVYTYRIPEGMDIKVGMRVSVPFNNRFIEGYVISTTDKASYSVDKIKDIHRILDSYSIFDEKMIELAKWMKEYNKCYSLNKTPCQ